MAANSFLAGIKQQLDREQFDIRDFNPENRLVFTRTTRTFTSITFIFT
jgi:hypothetical protein